MASYAGEDDDHNASSSNSSVLAPGANPTQDVSFVSSSLNSAQPVSEQSKTTVSVPENAGAASEAVADSTSPTDGANEVAPLDSSAKVTNAPRRASGAAKAPPAPKSRLPHDIVGIYEDRIKDDPRGDSEAWLSLINEHRKRDKMDETRKTYNRFFKVFPMAAEQLVAYSEMELTHENFYEAEQIFSKFLQTVPSVQLWKVYLDYVRRRNNLTTDTTGQARSVISQSYDFVLNNVGNDPEAGQLWQEYIQFVRSGPGNPGGSAWQDQQKMDQLRKAYQRAICVPNQFTTTAWREYNSFEMGLNKQTGRKFLQEKSSAYVSAQAAYKSWQSISRGLQRQTLAKLPPIDGFEGGQEYSAQVALWKQWISWEKEDQLTLKEEDPKALNDRVLYVYKQALMALRFWPEIWFDAAEFCFQNGLDAEGDEFLVQGISANPESSLLAFRRADRLEVTLPVEEGDEGVLHRGQQIREPYAKLLDALYDLVAKNKAKEAQDLAKVDEAYIGLFPVKEEDDDEITPEEKERKQRKSQQVEGIKQFANGQEKLIIQCISHAWIALMRAMRRVQGRGNPNEPIGGSRKVFTDARKRGKINPNVYVAAATMEHYCYRDPVAKGIFERGAKLFPEDAEFALKYLKHLIATNDPTNARAFFEMAVGRITAKPENIPSAKPLFDFFHEYEASYGELSQLRNLEKRMKELFPIETQYDRFSHRFRNGDIEPTAIRLIISPAAQLKPKVVATAEIPGTVASPIRSPKRSLNTDDNDADHRPNKIMRSDSPMIKGAAGRKLHQQRQSASQDNRGAWTSHINVPPEPLPNQIWFILDQIPRADLYQSTRFNAEKVVNLLQRTTIPTNVNRLPPKNYQMLNATAIAPPPIPNSVRPPSGPGVLPYAPPGNLPPPRYY